MISVLSVIENSRKLLILTLFTAALFHLSCATGSSEKQEKPEDTINIVWPQPPDPPRVKFVEIIRSNRDVEGRTKRNLKEILLGIEPDRLAEVLKRPMDVVSDSAGRILVVDGGNPGIHVYDRSANSFAHLGLRGEGALAWPISIDVDQFDNIFVSDHSQKRVFKYDREGNYLLAMGDFQNPVGVAVDHERNRLFVVDSQAHHVKLFNLDGKLEEIIGERGVEEGQFNYPTFCEVDNLGSLYVVDTGNMRVQVFDSDLVHEGSFGSVGVNIGQFTRPKGITVDTFRNIYVVDGAFNNVQIFDKEFNLLMPFCGPGRDAGHLQLPTGIHVNERGEVFIADNGNSRLQIFHLLTDGMEENLQKKNRKD